MYNTARVPAVGSFFNSSRCCVIAPMTTNGSDTEFWNVVQSNSDRRIDCGVRNNFNVAMPTSPDTIKCIGLLHTTTNHLLIHESPNVRQLTRPAAPKSFPASHGSGGAKSWTRSVRVFLSNTSTTPAFITVHRGHTSHNYLQSDSVLTALIVSVSLPVVGSVLRRDQA